MGFMYLLSTCLPMYYHMKEWRFISPLLTISTVADICVYNYFGIGLDLTYFSIQSTYLFYTTNAPDIDRHGAEIMHMDT